MKGIQLKLAREWQASDRIGSGGFGQVFIATSADETAVVEFVPKTPVQIESSYSSILRVSATSYRSPIAASMTTIGCLS